MKLEAKARLQAQFDPETYLESVGFTATELPKSGAPIETSDVPVAFKRGSDLLIVWRERGGPNSKLSFALYDLAAWKSKQGHPKGTGYSRLSTPGKSEKELKRLLEQK